MVNMEVCKVRGEDGCGGQDKDDKMVTTSSFAGFGTTYEEGKLSSKDHEG